MTRFANEVEHNASAHDRLARAYDLSHGEIFNDFEQARLRKSLTAAVALVASGTSDRHRALDFGCGTGNLTRHLLELGLWVTAADVSSKSLALLGERYGHLGALFTKRLSDAELKAEPPEQFDLVATYSVLHHVPNYLLCVEGLLRVLRPGGILYIDHEASPQYWDPPAALAELRSITSERVSRLQKALDPHRVLNPRWWYQSVRRALNKKYMPEGDIHVWPDDHIEWNRISDVLRAAGAECVLVEDYLLFRAHYSHAVYTKYEKTCADMRLIVARQPLASAIRGAAQPRT